MGGRGIVNSFKSLGDGTWEGIFSNIFWDREKSAQAPLGERFTYDGLNEFAEWANSDPSNMPVLELWHLDDIVMGQATDVEVIGPYIYAKGLWGTDEIGQKAKAYFESDDAKEVDWRMSHGFRYWVKDWKDGEIQRFRSRELTVIPAKWAANLGTKFSEDANMSLREDLIKSIANVLGVKAEDAAKMIQESEAKKSLTELPDGQREGTKDAAPVAEITTSDTPSDDEAPVVTDQTLLLAIVDLLSESDANREKMVSLEATVAEMATQVKTLTEGLPAITEAVKSLQDSDSARTKLLPKAVVQALETRAKGIRESVPEKDIEADQKSQADQLGVKGKKEYKEDPLAWLAEQAGIPLGPVQQS